MVNINEIIVAIDPFLAKFEYILLWKHKVKSFAVFVTCHILFWLFINYNIRTYCIIASVLLILHLLDMYRTKRRPDLIKQHRNNLNITEGLSSTGKTIIYINNKIATLYSKLNWLKKRNRLIYFLVMFSFWSMMAIIGTKIQGYLLVYIFFLILFLVPAIVHLDIPRKLLRKALPLLEQLDQSMKYERRSVLDKSELLVDVQHKSTEETNEAEEDEYLKSFELGELSKSGRRIMENLEDEESLYSEHTENSEENSQNSGEDEEEDEVVEEVFEVQTFGRKNEEQFQVTKMISSSKPGARDLKYTSMPGAASRFAAPVKTSLVPLDVFDMNNDSLLNDEFLPSANASALSNAFNQSNDEPFNLQVDSGSRVMKKRAMKVRPNILDYYGGSSSSSSSTGQNKSQKTPQNERNIDETFDFLDEELNKYH